MARTERGLSRRLPEFVRASVLAFTCTPAGAPTGVCSCGAYLPRCSAAPKHGDESGTEIEVPHAAERGAAEGPMNRSRTDLTRRRRDSPRLPSGRGRPLPRWCVGLALVCCALLLGSCAAPGAQLGASPTAGPAQQTAVADQLEELRRQLRELQPTVERRHRVRFPLAAPTDFAGLTPEAPTANAPPGPPVVGIRLVDPRDGRRWIGVTQSIGGLGAWDMPMVGQATVRGAPAQLLASPDGTTVAVAWGRDGVSYAVTGVGIPREAVLRVAESLEPVR